jgi:hypothetical protein
MLPFSEIYIIGALSVFVYAYIRGYDHFRLTPLYALTWCVVISVVQSLLLNSIQVNFGGKLLVVLILGCCLFALLSLANHFVDRDTQELRIFIRKPDFWILTVGGLIIALVQLSFLLRGPLE